MSATPAIRRSAAEIEGQAAIYRIGNRSIHQFWHLFSAHFRHVLLAPQRRPDSGRVAWTWREEVESRPVTSTELTEVRRRLSESLRSLTRGFDDSDRGDTSAESIDVQVRAAVSEMVEQLVAQRDAALAAFVCRTDAGLMLHSWGAATAAKPFFPDTQNGEISGNVVIGAEHLTGVSVALENAQGAVLMRTQSEREGAFRFLNIASGNYRVRVLDRGEFPAEGIAVTMERESVTGLELRGKAEDSPSEHVPLATPVEISTPWYKRKWIAAVALLGALGIGGCIWNSSRTSSGQSQKNTKDSGWQSASGQLPGSDGKNNVRDDSKVGTGGTFSSLSSTLPPPKITQSKHGPDDGDNGNAGAKSFPDTTDSREENSGADSKNKIPEDERKPQRNPQSGTSAPAKQTPPTQSSSKLRPEEKSANDDAAGDVPGGDKPSPSKENSGDGSKRSLENKKTNQPISKAGTGDELPLNRSAETGPPLNPDSPVPNPGASSNNEVAKPLEKKSPTPLQKNVSPPSPTGNGASEEAEPSDATKSNTPDDPAKTNADQKKPGSRRPSGSDGSHSGADAPAQASEVAPVPAGESAATNSTDSNGTPLSNPLKKASAPKSDAQPQPNSPKQAGEEPKNEESTDSSDKKATKPQGPSSKKNSAAAKSSGAGADASADNSADTTEPSQNPEDNNRANSNPPGKSAKKSRPTSSSSPHPEQKSGEGGVAVEGPTVKSPGIAVVSGVKSNDADLIQINKIHASRWNVRMVQDLILPTRPLTAKEEDQMEALRQKIRQEQVAQMPPLFRHPKVKTGLIFEFAGAGFSAADSPHWQDESGQAISSGSVQGHAAQLEWPDSAAPIGAVYVLSSPGGKTLARVEINQGGSLALKTVATAQVRYWVGIETATTTDASPRSLEWRQSTGESIPASWSQDNEWLAGKGRRIEIPLDTASKRVGHYGISLIDAKTGWALSADVAFQ